MSAELFFAAVAAVAGVAALGVPLLVGRRAERRAAWSAARVLAAELKERHDTIAYALDENCWDMLLSVDLGLPSWDRSSQSLAVAVGDQRWQRVLGAVQAVELVAAVSGHQNRGQLIYPSAQCGAPEGADRYELTAAREEVREGVLALADYAALDQLAHHD